MERCSSAVQYRGLNKPTCNNNDPCHTCRAAYVRVRLTAILTAGLDADPVQLRRYASDALDVL